MQKASITASEIGMLWTQYIQNSMSVQMLKYFNQTAQNDDVKGIMKDALHLSESVTLAIKNFFQKEKICVPVGFGDHDVNVLAPPLFSDQCMLQFVENMGKAGMAGYSMALATAARKDIREFVTKCLQKTTELFNQTVDTALERGTYLRSPVLGKPTEVEFIEGKSYFSSGLNPFQKRPLNMIETAHLFENIKTNSLGEMMCTGFAQTTDSKEVKKYLLRGRDITKKHITIFEDILEDSNIKAPMSSDLEVTNTTTTVFSDKLMLFLMSMLCAAGQGNYATAASASMRYDIVSHYHRLSLEVGLFAEDGVDLLIKNKWLEEPPQAPDRKKLFKRK